MISDEQYKIAVIQKEDAEATIQAYIRQKTSNFEEKWKKFKKGEITFNDSELCYAAGSRCETCKAGLAYPKECGGYHFWSCSAELRGEVKGHATYPFAFYSIKSEGQPSAYGATTRPKSNS